jgi:hypothetical protein
MRGRIFECLVVVAVMAAVVWSGASPALAQTGWSVTNPNADGWFTGTGTTLTLANLDTGSTITCNSPVLNGSMGTAAGVEEIGTVTFADATDCSGPGGTVPGVASFFLDLFGVSYDPSAGRTTFEVLTFYPMNVYWPDCDSFATGVGAYDSFPMTYTNATSQLTADRARFTVTDAEGSGCAGEVEVGDTLELSVSYTLTPAITMVAQAPQFTVTGSTSDGRYTTTQSDATTPLIGNPTTSAWSVCSPSTVAGRLPNGTDLTGVGVGSITSADLGRCGLFAAIDGVFTVTPANLPWRLDAVSYRATGGSAVRGAIANFALSVTGPGCSFSITSTPTATDWLYGEWNSRPDVLLIHPRDAEISNVQGCGGVFNNGDEGYYSNAFAVSPGTLQVTAR